MGQTCGMKKLLLFALLLPLAACQMPSDKTADSTESKPHNYLTDTVDKGLPAMKDAHAAVDTANAAAAEHLKTAESVDQQ